MTDTERSNTLNPDTHPLQKEWDEISCPICMEHPHNAVLIICGSHENGCRSYICDTSHRHSNCLDRFKKLKVDRSSNHHRSAEIPSTVTSEPLSESPRVRRNSVEGEGSVDLEEVLQHRDASEANHLKCPLCRGDVTGWRIVKDARQYLDMKPRSCSRESCSFSGTYGELRRHARRVHPMTIPADVDPSRQRAWRHLERQREYGDILSAIRSAMPGAVMFGDYMIDDEDALPHDGEPAGDTVPWWATLFLFHMMSGPFGSRDESRASRVRRRSQLNRYLWGENLLGFRYDGDDDDDEILIPRRRRRFTRSRADEDRP